MGVKDYTGAEIISRGAKFTQTNLRNLEYGDVEISKWTDDDHTNMLISQLITNFMRKYKLLTHFTRPGHAISFKISTSFSRS